MKKTNFCFALLLAVATGAFIMTGCASSGHGKSSLYGDWIVTELKSGGSAVKMPSVSTTIAFEKNSPIVSGFSGVNNFSGSVSLGDGTISFGTIAVTMMAGAPEDERFEYAYLDVLKQAKTFSLSQDTLTIAVDQNNYVKFYRHMLQNTAWLLSAMSDGNAVVSVSMSDSEAPSIAFDSNDNVSGFTGVNQMMGNYIAHSEHRTIKFGDIGTTRMAPRDAEAAAMEQNFIAFLGKAASFQLSGNSLTLLDGNGTTLLLFVREN